MTDQSEISSSEIGDPKPANGPENVPTLYADFIRHVGLVGGVARLQMSEIVFKGADNDPPTVLRHVVNLAMPVAAAKNLVEYLGRQIEQWDKEAKGGGE